MDLYFTSFYSVHCNLSSFSWFDSWHYPATVSHALSAILIPLNFYGGYCILYKSSEKLNKAKWAMLNVHFWTSFLDFLISTLLTPYVFLPLFCGYSVGILNLLGVPVLAQLFMIQVSLASVGASLIILFENRHNAIVQDRFKITRTPWRIAFYTFNFGIGVVFLLPIYFFIPDQEPAKLKMLQLIPCPTPEFFNPEVFVLSDMSNSELIGRLIHIHFAIQTLQGFFFVPRTVYYLIVKNPSLSENTRKLQRKVFKCIIIQISVPMAVLVGPMIYIWISVYLLYYNQALTNTLTISLSLHGMCSTLVILVIYEPYRTFTKQWIMRLFGFKSPSVEAMEAPQKSIINAISVI